MMLKRKLLAILPLVALGVALTGCGKSEEETAPSVVPASKSDSSSSGVPSGTKKEPAFAGSGGLPSASGPATTK